MSKHHVQQNPHLGKHSELSINKASNIADLPLTEDFLESLPESFFEVPKQKRNPKGQGGHGKEIIGIASIEEL